MSEPNKYPPAVAELLEHLPLAPLGPGRPIEAVRPKLAALADESFGTHSLGRKMIAACRAGLWLAFDFLDESHAISQAIDTPEGSFWHAIMHRREPDAGNSKYWWRRVGGHPVLERLVERSPALGYSYSDPFTFVDFVERVRGTSSPQEEVAKLVQRLEWELLFHHCYQSAIAG
ncbi:MAG: hypothetical protein U0797_01375 [Gemmataceae bacterium]